MKSTNCPDIQYAIIRASSTHDSPEPLVLAYADENSLRSLIAGPSIIALGFASRSAAAATVIFQQRAGSHHMHAMSAIRNVNHRFALAFHFSTSQVFTGPHPGGERHRKHGAMRSRQSSPEKSLRLLYSE
jgi:hypothetical protein